MLQLNRNEPQFVCSPQAPLQEKNNITDNTKTDHAYREISVVNVISEFISMPFSLAVKLVKSLADFITTPLSFVKNLINFTGITKEEKVKPILILKKQETKLDIDQEIAPEKIDKIQKAVDQKFNDVPKIYNHLRPTKETLINNELQDQEKIPQEKLTKYLHNNMLEASYEQKSQQESKNISFVTDKKSGSLVSEAKLFRQKTDIRLCSNKDHSKYKKYTHFSAVAKTQGDKPYMEDISFIDNIIIKGNFIMINSICDGHGGKDIPKFCANYLTNIAKLNLLNEDRKNNIKDIFICNMLRGLPVEAEKAYIKSLKPKTDNPEEHEKYTEAFSQGTTANICMFTNDAIWTANVGDSRAIIIDPRGNAVQTSITPDLRKKNFQDMVTKRGGSIYDVRGTYRVNTVLNMGSSVGDYHLFGATSPVSQITKFVRDHRDRSWYGYTLIQVTDGVTDVLTTQQIANLVNYYLKEGCSLKETAEELVAVAYKLGSSDNITVTIQQRHSSS